MRSVRLLALAVLTVGLMMFTPAMAVKGSYPGRNGKIAFDAPHPDHDDLEIYVMNADGTGLQDLSNNHAAEDYGAAWSPDGAKIAFTRSIVCGEDEATCSRIFVMNADGTGSPHPYVYVKASEFILESACLAAV
jgi:Tol biopolymer transport system component